MAKLFDLVKVNIATTGTGTITFGSVFSPEFFTPSEVGAADGDTVRYVLIDGSNIELGTGTIGGSVTTMARSVTRSRVGGVAGTSLLNLSGTAYLALTAAAADIPIVNSASASYSTYTSYTTIIPSDDTIPQSTEGTQVLTCSITPTSATNVLRVSVSIPEIFSSSAVGMVAAIFQDSGVNAIAASYAYVGNLVTSTICGTSLITGTTSAITFKLRIGPATAGTIYLNGNASTRMLGGVQAVTMTIQEFKA